MAQKIRVTLTLKMLLKTPYLASENIILQNTSEDSAYRIWGSSRGINPANILYVDNFKTYRRSGSHFAVGDVVVDIFEGIYSDNMPHEFSQSMAEGWCDDYGFANDEVVEVNYEFIDPAYNVFEEMI